MVKEIINNVDRFFLMMDAIHSQTAEQGHPDEDFLNKFHDLALELTTSEAKEVMTRYYGEIVRRDFFGNRNTSGDQ